ISEPQMPARRTLTSTSSSRVMRGISFSTMSILPVPVTCTAFIRLHSVSENRQFLSEQFRQVQGHSRHIGDQEQDDQFDRQERQQRPGRSSKGNFSDSGGDEQTNADGRSDETD